MTSAFAHCNDIHVNHYAKAFWQTDGEPGHALETILPKGVVELIFSFGDPIPFNENTKNFISTPRCFISGMRDTRIQLISPARQSFFGVELHPVAVKKILRLPAGELLNEITDLENIDKAFTSLWHRLAEAGSFESRVFITKQWLLKKMSPIQDRERSISHFLTTDPSPVSVTGLASELVRS